MASNQPFPIPMGPPPTIKVVHQRSKGRFIIAAGTIKPGQIIFQEHPLVLYPASITSLSFFCSCCFRVLLPSQQFPCPICHVANFCSARCLSVSHPVFLCHALPYLINQCPSCPSELLFLLSAYSLRPELLIQLLSLHSYLRCPDSLIEDLHANVLFLLHRNQIPVRFSREITSYLLSKQKVNSFPLSSPTDKVFERYGFSGARAYGIYFHASLISHDCLPNVCTVTNIEGPDQTNFNLMFKALYKIDEGKEICISYVGMNMGYRDRQRMLKTDYRFNCECKRCETENQWLRYPEVKEEFSNNSPYANFLERHMCNRCGDGYLVPFVDNDWLMECNCCGGFRSRTDDEPGAAKDANSTL